MKKYILPILFFLSSSFAQVDFSVGMGINGVAAPSLYDYVNYNFANKQNDIKNFAPAISFFAEAGHDLSESSQLALEYNLSIFSFSTLMDYSYFDISYNLHKPSLLYYYCINGTGYKFKFGFGLGPRFAKITQKLIIEQEFTSAGFGGLLKFSASTAIDENFYANICVDLRADLSGKPTNSGTVLYNSILKEEVNLNTISGGLSLGVLYYLKF